MKSAALFDRSLDEDRKVCCMSGVTYRIVFVPANTQAVLGPTALEVKFLLFNLFSIKLWSLSKYCLFFCKSYQIQFGAKLQSDLFLCFFDG